VPPVGRDQTIGKRDWSMPEDCRLVTIREFCRTRAAFNRIVKLFKLFLNSGGTFRIAEESIASAGYRLADLLESVFGL